jgi:hypothetical protein
MNKQAHRTEGPKNWRRALVLLAATASLGIVGLSASAASAAASPAVPFGFTVAGTASVSGSAITLNGAGLGTGLGIVRYQASGVVTGENPATGVITDTLTETLTAANGSTVTILCHQVATPVSSGVYNGVDNWTVTGGTGTFSGATGSGSGGTRINLNQGTFAKVEAGTITR